MNSRIDKNIDDALFDFYLNADKETIDNVIKDNIQNYEQYSKKKKQIAFITKAIAKQKHNNELLELDIIFTHSNSASPFTEFCKIFTIPIIAFIGVLTSCDTTDKNSDFAMFAFSATSRAFSISR